ncbi:hypothetical protein Cch01nite_18640 [Cellulomonas chitinilytica]|uniref:Uncharacterized protein n=1 Tax=Cellulomonas chitinilytica TaxID=398759 RepID=A0A919TYZ8_9CELL|nr:hypothetical protein [Cellulomonas chitinilytica]GIG21140.1 hypothetical protein Cch01nite_18640 [Cellulomonas chitinilytica]
MSAGNDELGSVRRHLGQAQAEIVSVKRVREVARLLEGVGNAGLPEQVALEHAAAVSQAVSARTVVEHVAVWASAADRAVDDVVADTSATRSVLRSPVRVDDDLGLLERLCALGSEVAAEGERRLVAAGTMVSAARAELDSYARRELGPAEVQAASSARSQVDAVGAAIDLMWASASAMRTHMHDAAQVAAGIAQRRAAPQRDGPAADVGLEVTSYESAAKVAACPEASTRLQTAQRSAWLQGVGSRPGLRR